MLPNRVSYVDLVELDMFDFDIILGMDLLHACFASIDCRTRVVRYFLSKSMKNNVKTFFLSYSKSP